MSLTLLAGDLNYYDAATGTTMVYNNGDIAWTLAATALVWIMIPGVGFFYSGLLRRKNALSMIYLSMMTVAVVSFQVCAEDHTHSTLMLNMFYSGFSGDSRWRSATQEALLSGIYVGLVTAVSVIRGMLTHTT